MSEVRAKKALGQHFLVDLNIARKICDALSGGVRPGTSAGESAPADMAGNAGAGADTRVGTDGCADAGVGSLNGGGAGLAAGADARIAADTTAAGAPAAAEAGRGGAVPCDVLEVGCGRGVLTQFLLRRGDITTYGAEIDPESVEYLHAHFPEFAPRLIEGDFLKMNLRERFPRGLKIIGNFPYNISSQIFFKVLENRDLVPECVGMIQKEVAVRIAEPPGSKEYGILSVLLQAWYDIEYLFTVNETVFNPPPKVKSAVIRLRRNRVGRLGCDEALFVKVVKASFGQRRKMIRNSLRGRGAPVLHTARRAALGRRFRAADRLGRGQPEIIAAGRGRRIPQFGCGFESSDAGPGRADSVYWRRKWKSTGSPVLFSCRSAGGVLLRSRNAQASIFAGLPQ